MIRDWSVNAETGEAVRSKYSIGFVKVEEARDRVGVGKYVSKYITKPWEAVPAWMLDSCTRFRKVRLSGAFYEVLERLHRHTRHSGGRREPSGKLKPTRRLRDRMATSGSACVAFVKRGGRLHFLRSVYVPLDDLALVAQRRSARWLRLGKFVSLRLGISEADLTEVCRDRRWDVRGERSAAFRERSALTIGVSWELMQQRRAEQEGDRAGFSDVAGAGVGVRAHRRRAARFHGRGREALKDHAFGVPADAGGDSAGRGPGV
jgi:hypothetical protein